MLKIIYFINLLAVAGLFDNTFLIITEAVAENVVIGTK